MDSNLHCPHEHQTQYLATIQKFGISKVFFFFFINTFIQQWYIKVSDIESEDIYNLTEDSINQKHS